MIPSLKLGKLPARPNAIKFKLNNFLGGTKPVYPAEFGHEEWSPPTNWGMLGNDVWGVCVIAGGAHEVKHVNRLQGKQVGFTPADIREDFEACTGKPVGPVTGADMQQAASYRRRIGLRDNTGLRHKIGAYLEIQAGNVVELLTAVYLFDFAGIGFRVYSSVMDDFIRHHPWGYSRDSGSYEGDHYVPAVALRGNIVTVSWGRFQPMRIPFFINHCDEAVAYVSPEQLVDGKSPEGFDYATLNQKLTMLGG